MYDVYAGYRQPESDIEVLEYEHYCAVFSALVSVTDYDSFAEKDMEVFYGDNYDQPVTEQMLQVVSTMTGLPLWKVRDITLDDCIEARYIDNCWHYKDCVTGQWRKPLWMAKEFAND